MLKDLKKIMTKELRGSMRLPQQIENINRKTEIIKKYINYVGQKYNIQQSGQLNNSSELAEERISEVLG